MKIAVIIVVAAVMLADAFLMWCLLRANALYEQNESKCGNSADIGGEGKETYNEKKENL